ncbi:MAG: putative inorganic carbon transporter subunit DabA, partial [Pseudomonadota bacterium]
MTEIIPMDMQDLAPPALESIEAAAERAERMIAPLWPLKHFVAVNPFLGLGDRRFVDAAHAMARSAGARMTMPRNFYAAAIASGRIGDTDLADALGEVLAEADVSDELPKDVAALKAAAQSEEGRSIDVLDTVADVATKVTGKGWASFATERISSWAAGYFDDGQAAWASPWRTLPPYAAWRKEALIDRTPEVMGLAGFRQIVARLPQTANEMLLEAHHFWCSIDQRLLPPSSI